MRVAVEIFFVVLMIIGTYGVIHAEVIFEDNFDSHPDWTGTYSVSDDASPAGGSYSCKDNDCGTLPTGYDYAYMTGMWFEPTYPNPVYIRGTLFDGRPLIQPNGTTGGKSYLVYSEPVSASGGWGSDSLLGKKLNTEYTDLYIRIKMKFQPGWTWNTVNSPMQKFFRMGHYRGTGGGPWDSNNGGNSRPLFIWDYAKYNSGATDLASIISLRCSDTYFCTNTASYQCYDSSSTDVSASGHVCYFPPDGSYGGDGADFRDSGMPGDGNWHLVEWRMKMNSATGVADGEVYFWFDGVLISRSYDVVFNDSAASRIYGINFFLLGGNNYNWYPHGANERPEQWYAYDDLVVYTAITPVHPLWQISPQDGRLPLGYAPGTAGPPRPEPPAGLTVQNNN